MTGEVVSTLKFFLFVLKAKQALLALIKLVIYYLVIYWKRMPTACWMVLSYVGFQWLFNKWFLCALNTGKGPMTAVSSMPQHLTDVPNLMTILLAKHIGDPLSLHLVNHMKKGLCPWRKNLMNISVQNCKHALWMPWGQNQSIMVMFSITLVTLPMSIPYVQVSYADLDRTYQSNRFWGCKIDIWN